jgi:hypothetical protein
MEDFSDEEIDYGYDEVTNSDDDETEDSDEDLDDYDDDSDESSVDIDIQSVKETLIFPKKGNSTTSATSTTTNRFPIPVRGGNTIPVRVPIPEPSREPKTRVNTIPQPKNKSMVSSTLQPLAGIKLPEAKITDEINQIIEKMPGINISHNNNNSDYDSIDINDLLVKETSESPTDFKIRTDLTIKISKITNPKINNNTAVTLGFMISKKLRYHITYDDEIENVIKAILANIRNI